MKRTMIFSDFALLNPSVSLKKDVEYPFVPMDAITPGSRSVFVEKRIYTGGGTKFRSGDTLFARITPCLENGKIVQFRGSSGDVGFGSTEFFIFRAREEISDPDYIFYLALSDILRNPAEKSMSGTSGRQRADIASIRDLEVPAPPLPTQRKIAAILSVYVDLIENNTRRIAILEEMAQALYREWFVHFRFPCSEKKSMVESALGMIPEGWEVVRLGDVAYEKRRSVNPEAIDPETPYFGLEHLPRKSIALSEWGTAKEVQSTKLAFYKDEILFGKIRPYFHKVGVAPLNGVCSSDTIVILPKNDKYYGLVLSCVSSEDFVSYATRTSQGTKMPRANWDVLVKYPVVLPSEQMLTYFNNFIHDIVSQIQNLIFHNRNLRRTRDLLLPKLISGELDVEGLAIALDGDDDGVSVREEEGVMS